MAIATVTMSSKKLFFNKTFNLITFSRFLRPSPKSSNAIPNETPSITTTKGDDDDIPDRNKEEEEEMTMRHVFDHFDFDKDGKISCEELVQYLESAGELVTQNGAKRVIRDFDSDDDDLLEYGDFVRLLGEKEKDESGDDDGVMTLCECGKLREAMGIGPAQIYIKRTWTPSVLCIRVMPPESV